MRHSERMEKGVIYTAAVLLCLVLASFWLTGNIYARYATTDGAEDEARAAKFDITEAILDDGSAASEVLSFDLAPGEDKTYIVQVTNKSEVAVEYSVTAESQYHNLPLKVEMLDSNLKEIEKDNLPANENSMRTYSIKVSWPIEDNTQSENYMGRTDLLIITLRAVQIN